MLRSYNLPALDHFVELIRVGDLRVEPDGRILDREGRRHDRPQSSGYRRLVGQRDGRQVQALAHRVVWAALRGPIPWGSEIDHLNGRKGDNRPENLELVSPSENRRRAYARGLGHIKVTDEQVAEIAASREHTSLLAKRYGVSVTLINQIRRGTYHRVRRAHS